MTVSFKTYTIHKLSPQLLLSDRVRSFGKKSFSSFQTKKKRKMSKMEEQDGSESNVATMRKLLSSYYGIDKEDVKSKQQDLDSEDFDADAVRYENVATSFFFD